MLIDLEEQVQLAKKIHCMFPAKGVIVFKI